MKTLFAAAVLTATCLHGHTKSGQTRTGRAEAVASAKRDGAAMAATVRQQWPGGVVTTQARPSAWAYETGTALDGMAAIGTATHTEADLAYVEAAVDRWVQPDGSIQTEPGKPFNPGLHTLDDLEPGRAVLFVYQQTHDDRYRKAAAYLFAQFAAQPRNSLGGYWHKGVYPDQMWLDGAYMAEAAIRAGGKTHIADWARANGVTISPNYMREDREGGLHAVGSGYPAPTTAQLTVLPSALWQAHAKEYAYEGWAEKTRLAEQASSLAKQGMGAR